MFYICKTFLEHVLYLYDAGMLRQGVVGKTQYREMKESFKKHWIFLSTNWWQRKNWLQVEGKNFVHYFN